MKKCNPVEAGVLAVALAWATAPLTAQCHSAPPPPPDAFDPASLTEPPPSRPSRPSRPAKPGIPGTPTLPRTPGDRGPSSTPRGGSMPLILTRNETSKRRLKIRWDLPVPESEELLDFKSALAEIRGEDKRPLLVLRECTQCDGTDRALLLSLGNNEKTYLLTSWFHCVKLPKSVMDSQHPWHALFDGRWPPHLFLASWDGSTIVPLRGDQSRNLLWKSMHKVLAIDYRNDPAAALKSWLRILNRFDYVDSKRKVIERQLDRAIEKTGPGSPRVRELRDKLRKLGAERQRLRNTEKKVSELGLKRAIKKSKLLEKTRDAAGK